MRRCVLLGFRSAPTPANDCDETDDRLFSAINNNSRHRLRSLLPPAKNKHHNLLKRSYSLRLPVEALGDSSFIKKMQYKKSGSL